MVEVDLEAVVGDVVDDVGEEAEQALLARVLVVERRQHQHATAAEVDGMLGQRIAVSATEHVPVPGISFAGSTPASTSSSSSSMRSSRPSELASLVVPNGARPVQPLLQQPIGMVDEAVGVGRAVVAEGCRSAAR